MLRNERVRAQQQLAWLSPRGHFVDFDAANMHMCAVDPLLRRDAQAVSRHAYLAALMSRHMSIYMVASRHAISSFMMHEERTTAAVLRKAAANIALHEHSDRAVRKSDKQAQPFAPLVQGWCMVGALPVQHWHRVSAASA